jgi:hypothetical protein
LDGLVGHGVEDRAAHHPVRAHAALIASRQLRHLALQLPLGLGDVAGVLAEDAAGGHLVQVVPLAPVVGLERRDLPLLVRQPRQHAAFDVRQVGDDQLGALGRDQRAAHGEGAALADVVPDQVLAVGLHGGDGGRLHLVVEPVRRARQVLRLEQPAGIAPSARRAAELDQAAQAAVPVRGVEQHLVLGRARRGRLLPYLQQLAHLRIEVTAEQVAERAARQVLGLEAVGILEVIEQALALRGGRDAATRQSGGTSGQRSSSSVESSES